MVNKCWICEKKFNQGDDAIKIEFERVKIIDDEIYPQFVFSAKLVHVGECMKKALEVIRFYE